MLDADVWQRLGKLVWGRPGGVGKLVPSVQEIYGQPLNGIGKASY